MFIELDTDHTIRFDHYSATLEMTSIQHDRQMNKFVPRLNDHAIESKEAFVLQSSSFHNNARAFCLSLHDSFRSHLRPAHAEFENYQLSQINHRHIHTNAKELTLQCKTK